MAPVTARILDIQTKDFISILGKLMQLQFLNTVELYLSGLTGTTSHPDMLKIRII